jgi:1,4-dihydroxy-2-naphthoyl-CoA hydrolase
MAGEGTANRWAELLNSAVSGVRPDDSAAPPRPPVVERLGLPGLTSWEPGVVRGDWVVDPQMFHAGGALFGGFLAALGDLATTFATFSVLKDDEWFNTADLRTSFFRPVSGGTLHFESRVIHRGKRTASVEVEFTDEQGRMVAKGSATQVIQPLPEGLG